MRYVPTYLGIAQSVYCIEPILKHNIICTTTESSVVQHHARTRSSNI